MIKSTTLFKVGTGLAAIVSAIAFTSAPTLAAKKPAIEVVTHAGAGGGTDVNSRMMMLRSRRVLKQDMVVVNKRGGGGAAAADARGHSSSSSSSSKSRLPYPSLEEELEQRGQAILR